MRYKKLEIWKLSKELVIEIHRMSIEELPRFEMFETGSQIRRSAKSIKTNIVEGYGRRYYKQEFIRFIVYTLASRDETYDHLDTLFETGSLKNKEVYKNLSQKLHQLGKMLNKFLQAIQSGHNSPR